MPYNSQYRSTIADDFSEESDFFNTGRTVDAFQSGRENDPYYEDVENFDDDPVGTMITYIVRYNPEGAMKFVDSYGAKGYLAPGNLYELHLAVLRTISRHGETAVSDLAKYHPDYEFLKEEVIEAVKKPKRYWNANGDDDTENSVLSELQRMEKKYENMSNLVKLLIGLVIVYFIIKNTKN